MVQVVEFFLFSFRSFFTNKSKTAIIMIATIMAKEKRIISMSFNIIVKSKIMGGKILKHYRKDRTHRA
jgi:hypothetical protein